MGKSSSSKKRKSSKYSSKGRSKKRSKTRRSKLKKLRRHGVSVSYSDDDSTSSVSDSSSSSSDVHRNRRSRLRSRKDVKGSKKRARSPSSSSEGSPYPRKRRRSKKDNSSAARKKRSKKKKKEKKVIRRDSSVSSRSSESCNCSACQSSGSSSSDENECNRHSARSERRDNYKRKSEKTKFESERSYRSRSCSSCSGLNGGNDSAYGEQVNYDDNTKRLRSVITRINEDEGKALEMDENKEEMVYDHDDYPLCRSNDSNDGDRKRESAHYSHATSKKMPSDNEEKEGSLVSKIETPGHAGRNKDREAKYGRSRYECDRTETVSPKNEISMTDCTMDGEELESILRQKALENLRIFRGDPGELRTDSNTLINLKDEGKGTPEPLSNAVLKSGQIEFPRDNADGLIPGHFTCSLRTTEIVADNTNGGNKLGFMKNKINAPARVGVAGIQKVDTANGSGTDKSRLVKSSPRQAVLSAVTKQTEASSSEKSDQAKLVAPNFTGENVAQTAHTKPPSICSVNDNTDRASIASVATTTEPSSCPTPAAAGEESKEGSKFEQKTMSVMRGGEMVQVSYKVYIPPKKTPAARRQLNR